MPDLPTTDPEITTFLRAFETCTLPKAEWTHAAHLLTGACYVHAHGEATAIEKMRTNVRCFNESVGGRNTPTSGYHETITVAWIKLLAAFLRDTSPSGRPTFAHLAVTHFAPQRNIFAAYYSFNLVENSHSRMHWVEPDLKCLP